MIKGLGTDIIEISRVGKACEKENFLTRIFTEAERKYAEGKYERFAGMFAAKEAVWKALGTGSLTLNWNNIEISHDGLGKPQVSLAGKVAEKAAELGINEILISISHCEDYATATAIAVGE